MLNAPALLRALTDQHVEFVVVGGLAMITQGSAHITDDLDLCYARGPQNILALARALAPFHPYLRGAPEGLPFRWDERTIEAGMNFTLTTDHGPVDVLGFISGIGTYQEAFALSEEHTVFGFLLRVLSLDALITAKKAAGRTKDRLHLLELEELRKLRQANDQGK